MTKQNPDELCAACDELDYIMNRSSEVSLDMFIRCDCDEEVVHRIDHPDGTVTYPKLEALPDGPNEMD